MEIEVLDNPNCRASEQFVFNELEPARPIRGIVAEIRGREIICDVVGVEPGGSWVQAYVQKITDSGAGFAYLISGGLWGIRLRPEAVREEIWDLTNRNQWGEPFKIYGEEKDIFYGNLKTQV